MRALAVLITTCRYCGFQFQSAIQFSGTVVLSGNRETCPRCGRLTSSPEGTFSIVKGLAKRVDIKSEADARRALEIARQVRDGAIDVEQAATLMSGIDPNLVYMLRNHPGLVTIFLIIVMMTKVISSFASNVQFDLNEYLDKVTVEEVKRVGRSDPPKMEADRSEDGDETAAPLPKPRPQIGPEKLSKRAKRRAKGKSPKQGRS